MKKRALQAGLFLKKLLLCHIFGDHDWTCAAAEGIKPTPKQLTDGVAGFMDYARTYCKRCEVENRSSKEAREKYGRA